MAKPKVKVLFVCLGNICRSPTAHGVFEKMVVDADLSDVIDVDSCGTAGYHVGSSPDSRSAAAAKQRGYDLSLQRARQFSATDFENFDFILTMDENNLSDVKSLQPLDHRKHVGLFLEFCSNASYREVPDPYYGGTRGFELVLDLVEDASKNLLAHIQKTL
ncbi:MAG: low molecular weight phosphotyrosine protein phosphatase [Cellvibrionaceae bacterium]